MAGKQQQQQEAEQVGEQLGGGREGWGRTGTVREWLGDKEGGV
jgi:hypothetical protein